MADILAGTSRTYLAGEKVRQSRSVIGRPGADTNDDSAAMSGDDNDLARLDQSAADARYARRWTTSTHLRQLRTSVGFNMAYCDGPLCIGSTTASTRRRASPLGQPQRPRAD